MRTFSISRHLARLAAVTVFSLACAGPVLADAPEDTQFAALATRFIDEYGIYSPIGATKLGDHRRDGEMDDVSAAGRERGLAWTRGLQAELAKIPRERLSRENQIDAAVLDNQLRYSVWSVEKYHETVSSRGSRIGSRPCRASSNRRAQTWFPRASRRSTPRRPSSRTPASPA